MENNLSKLLKNEFFEVVPFNVAVIDRHYNVVAANDKFQEYFGKWQGRRCYEVYKKVKTPCIHCRVDEVFKTGKVRFSDETGIDKDGNVCHYIVHFAPLKDENGEVKYVIEMSNDISHTSRYQREYNILFERVPCYVTVIDNEHKIIRANEKFRQTFGEVRGRHCYEVYKKRKQVCKNCPAEETFKDGLEHTSPQTGVSDSGDEVHYIVNTTPLTRGTDGHSLVIEIAYDISELCNLQNQLHQAQDFHTTLIQNSADGIIALNNEGKVLVFNPAVRKMLNWTSHKKPGVKKIRELLPGQFFKKADENGVIARLSETGIRDSDGNEIPARFEAVELRSKKDVLGRVAFIQDLRKIKELEKDKLCAERLAATGQTVEWTANMFLNMMKGMDSSMYLLESGFNSGDSSKILQGWESLRKAYHNSTSLAKELLGMAKFKLPEMKLLDPVTLIKTVAGKNNDDLHEKGISLSVEFPAKVKAAPLDPFAITGCLNNLIENAADAVIERKDEIIPDITIKAYDDNGSLIFEVADNGIGMDKEFLKNLFTKMESTKNGKSLGTGLFRARKVILEHGG